MAERLGHRLRWILAAVLFILWSGALVLDLAGAAANLILAAAIVLVLYELLAADRSTS